MTQIQTLESTDTFGKFVLTPLERGYGTTIGNALRRMLLGSIPGSAIRAVRVEKVLHEFAPIPGCKEDMTEFLLNVRNLAIRVNSDRPPESDIELVIDVKGKGRVTGIDVKCPENVEIVNPDCYLCTISDARGSLYAELYAGWGVGYLLPDKQDSYKGTIGLIPIGTQFTPVRKVNYSVESTRVGQRTDYERLTLDVWTNGAVKPAVAVSQAAQILDRYFKMFFELGEGGMVLSLDEIEDEIPELAGVPDLGVEEMEFSQRTYNCLRRANILTLKDLVLQSESDLYSIRGFGKKALTEVTEKLSDRGLSLRPSKPGSRIVMIDDDDDEDYEE